MSASFAVSNQMRFLGLTADEFFTKFNSLADIQSYLRLVIEQPDKYGISLKNADRAAAWLNDFLEFQFDEEPLNVFFETKEYRYCGVTIPVHSPIESLVYAMSLVEPPENAIETSWYEVWALCISKLMGVASPVQAPVTLSLMYTSPVFELPASWGSKYVVGTSMPLRLVDHSGQLIPNTQVANEKRNMITRERRRLAVKCGVVVPGQSSTEPVFPSKNAFHQIIGLCAQHVPSCVILKTVPAEHATHFTRLAIDVDPVAKVPKVSVKRDGTWKPFFKEKCINCIDGYCNPAGYAASKLSATKFRSG